MTALDQILAHLATSDAAARAATPGDYEICGAMTIWSPESKAVIAKVSELRASSEVRFSDPSIGSPDFHEICHNALHIATHSPATILRMNAALRELVEAVEAAPHDKTECVAGMPGLHGVKCQCWKSRAIQRAAERLQPAPAGKEGR